MIARNPSFAVESSPLVYREGQQSGAFTRGQNERFKPHD
jgi:hypothetical protein